MTLIKPYPKHFACLPVRLPPRTLRYTTYTKINSNHATPTPRTTDDTARLSLASRVAMAAVDAPAAAGTASTVGHSGVATTTNPPAFAEVPSALPSSEFPGLHNASLVAGAGGVRCLAVGLAVLQKVCPPVHRRLARAAAERCGSMREREGAIYLVFTKRIWTHGRGNR